MFDQSYNMFDQRFGSKDDNRPKTNDHVHKAGVATRDKITQVFKKQAKLSAKLKHGVTQSNPA